MFHRLHFSVGQGDQRMQGIEMFFHFFPLVDLLSPRSTLSPGMKGSRSGLPFLFSRYRIPERLEVCHVVEGFFLMVTQVKVICVYCYHSKEYDRQSQFQGFGAYSQ